METENDKKSRNIGLIATIGFHGAIVLLFLLLMAWKAPNPPLAEYGVEINLGFQEQGSGEEQIATDPGNEGTTEESATQPTETQPEEVKEEAIEEQAQEKVVTDETNPVTVKREEKTEDKTEVKTEPKKEPVKTVTEPKKQEVKQETVFNPNQTTDKTNSQKTGENKSEGDDKNKTGNKGQPDGTLDPNASYTGIKGGGAGGNGTGLDLAGWKWDRRPDPKIPENESGRLVFEIWVDGDGEITKLVLLERGLSAAAEKICRDEVMKLTFTPTGTNVPEISKGKITFVVKAQ
jgi:periplasmic protein TonB